MPSRKRSCEGKNEAAALTAALSEYPLCRWLRLFGDGYEVFDLSGNVKHVLLLFHGGCVCVCMCMCVCVCM